MIRVVLFLLAVGLLALGAAWFVDRPGDISITWLGFQIETSVMFAAAMATALVIVAVAAWSLLRWALRSPRRIRRAMRERRRERGHLALSRGLIAIGAGDAGTAQKFSAEADRLAGNDPLALLLSAQTAQLSGDREAAERAFRRMAARPDTRLLGLRGLYVEAQRRADADAAHGFAEEAAGHAPGLPWAGQAVLEFRCASGDWAGALDALAANVRGKVVDKAAYRRQRAVLLTAQAQSLADARPAEARAMAGDAAQLAPDLPPAAALAARLLIDNGESRKAARLLEAAWRAQPHPDLAEAYANLKTGDSARERLRRVQTLVRQRAEHVEAAFAVARAALDAQEFATVRKALGPLLAAPTRRVAMLMAELEDVGRGDEGRAREWMARALRAPRDPAWTADGIVSEHWMPISPVSGHLDAFQWKVPVEEIDDGHLLDARDLDRDEEGSAERQPANPPPAAIAAATPSAATPPVAEATGAPPAVADASPASAVAAPAIVTAPVTASEIPLPVTAAVPVAATAATAAAPPPVASPPKPALRPDRIETVIPLIHAPDDPGPDADSPPGAAGDRSRGLRSLFR